MATDKLVDFDHVTDYISREAAIRAAFKLCRNTDYPFIDDIQNAIEEIPVVDVVEIVRCKDCRHRDPEDRKCDSGEMERQGCVFPVDDDYFCAYGER